MKDKKVDNDLTVYKILLPIVIAVFIFLVIKNLVFNYQMMPIDVDGYLNLVKGNDKSLVYVTSDDCAACEDAKKLLVKMLQGSKIKTYIINVDDYDDTKKLEFMNAFEETSDGVLTPALLMVQKDTLISSYYGPFDEDLVIKYLQDNELVKKVKIENSDNNE